VVNWSTVESGLSLGLLLIQVPAIAILLSRLLKVPAAILPLNPKLRCQSFGEGQCGGSHLK